MKFQSGSSGNPDGRPKGSGHRQQLFKSLVEPYQDALFDTAIKLALAGNEPMLRLFLERMLPAKPTDDAITMAMPEGMKHTEALLVYGELILQAVCQGEVTPNQGGSLLACLEAQRKNIETAELALRLAEIERTLKLRKREK